MPRIERQVTDISSCEFYHVVDLPDGSQTPGVWDLRQGVGQYLGGVDFSGKRIIEVGPASGFLSFHMEAHGGRVVSIEPPITQLWDYVPQPSRILDDFRAIFPPHISRIRNGFWYCHNKKGSTVELFEENAYDLPQSLGTFDIGLLSAVLLHTRSPVAMMESMAKLVTDTMVITELYFTDIEGPPVSRLAPGPDNPTCDTWWQFSTQFFVNFLAILGFSNSAITLSNQKLSDRVMPMFTVVARR